MATKVAPKQTEKPNVKAAADKEKLAAERAKLIEKSLPTVTDAVMQNVEAEEKVPTTFLELCDVISGEVEENEFTRDETKTLISMALMEVWNDKHAKSEQLKDLAEVIKSPILKFKISRILNLAHPKDKKIAIQIELAREKGVGIVALNAVATGAKKASEVAKSLGKGGNTKAKSAAKAAQDKGIEDVNKFTDAITTVAGKGVKGGISTLDIMTCFLSVYLELTEADEDYKDKDDDDKREELTEAFEACISGRNASQKD